MSEATKHPAWRFQPQAMFGGTDPDGERCATFGYLSIGTMPIFELNTFLEHKPELLREVALKACAADDMLALLKDFKAFAQSSTHFSYPSGSLQRLDAVIAKAEGRT
jgi:hypothetical protein